MPGMQGAGYMFSTGSLMRSLVPLRPSPPLFVLHPGEAVRCCLAPCGLRALGSAGPTGWCGPGFLSWAQSLEYSVWLEGVCWHSP